MKNVIYKMRYVALLFAVISMVFLTACDDEESASDEIVLQSFGPSGVQHGDEIVLIGENLDQVTAIVFQPGVEIAKSQFVSVTSEEIWVVLPETVEAGKVILKTPAGDIESITMLNLEVPVVITSVTEEARPGSNIIITGEMLNWIETITFSADKTVEKADFVSQTLTQVEVEVPMDAQTGYLKFNTGGTDPLELTSEEQLIVTLPVASELAPASIVHTEDLTINGTDLDLVTKISFPGGGEVEADAFESQTEASIVVAVPATTVAGKLTLTVPSGLTVQTEDALTIILPNVTAFNPSNTDNHDPGVTLIMTGTNLNLVGEIVFPGVATAVTTFIKTATQIDVVIPAGAQGGTVVIKTIHGFSIPVEVPFGDQLVLAKAIYDEAAQNGFGEWGGWESTTTWGSTERARVGTKSIKVDFNVCCWKGGAQMGNGNLSTAGTAYFAFSVYGGPGTGGKSLQILVKRPGGEATKQVTVVEGAWADFAIPLSELGNPSAITELFFQNTDGFSTGVVYIDQMGLK
ncbi:MAG TPA: hypothetical protein VGK46_13515 [Saprospiraceae bacterium]